MTLNTVQKPVLAYITTHVMPMLNNKSSANLKSRKDTTMWTKPAATEMRFGFEVTMYVCNR
jgi:pyrroloquinoline quinone biosynthesis protein A